MTNPHGSKWIRPTTRLAIYLRDNLQCVYCLASLEDEGVTLTLDHVKPREKGGSNAARNLVTACLGCNSRRQNREIGEFMTGHRLPIGVVSRVRNAVRRRLPRELARTLIGLRKTPQHGPEVLREVGCDSQVVLRNARVVQVHGRSGRAAQCPRCASSRALPRGAEYDPTGLGYLPKDTPPRPLHGRGQG